MYDILEQESQYHQRLCWHAKRNAYEATLIGVHGAYTSHIGRRCQEYLLVGRHPTVARDFIIGMMKKEAWMKTQYDQKRKDITRRVYCFSWQLAR